MGEKRSVCDVSIIIPTLNEAENIDLLLNRIFMVEGLQDYSFEVIISDGASEDDTCSLTQKWTRSHPVVLVPSIVNRGLSAAVMSGARVGRGEVVVVMDADLSHPPECIPDLLSPLFAGTHEMVVGSRYVKGGATPDWPMKRKLFSRLATLPARIFTDTKDPLAGFFAIRREALTGLGREVFGFKIGLELLATSESPFRVKEVPITFHDRQHGESKLGLEVLVDYIHQLLVLVGINIRQGLTWQRLVFLLLSWFCIDFLLTASLWHYGVDLRFAGSAGFVLASFLVITFGFKGDGNIAQPYPVLFPRNLSHLCTAFVIVLALTIRLGLFESCMAGGGGAGVLQLGGIIAVSIGAGYAGLVCYVFSIDRRRISGELVKRYYGIGLICYTFALRLAYGGVPFSESGEGVVSELFRFPINSGAALSSPVALLVPESYLGIRLGVIVLWTLSAIFIFSLARDMYDRSCGFNAVLLFSLLPYFGWSGFFATGDVVVILLWAACLYVLYRVLVVGARGAWLPAGLTAGLTLHCHWSVSIPLTGGLFYIFFHGMRPGWLTKRGIPAMIILSLAVWLASGYLVEDETLRLAGNLSWTSLIAEHVGGDPVLLSLLLVTPVGVLGAIASLGVGLASHRFGRGEESILTSFERDFVILCFLLPLVASLVVGYTGDNGGYLACVAWLGVLPAIAYTISANKAECTRLETVMHRLWWPTILVLTVCFPVVLQLSVTG